MQQFDMSVFCSLLLQRYGSVFTVEQQEVVDDLEARVCVLTPEQQQHAQQRFLEAWERLIQFFGDFAVEITGLGKATLLDVAMSYRKTTSARWHHMTNFFRRYVDNVTVEQKALLADWELVLCKVDEDPVVLLPGIRRSFDRVGAYLEDKKVDLISLTQPTLVAALSNKTLSKEPLCVFTCCFLKRYAEQLPVDLKEQLEDWEHEICGVAADELRAKRDQTSADNFESLLQFLSDSAEEILGLEKATLEEVVNSHRRNTSSRWKSAYEFLVRSANNLTVEQRQLLADWELVLCKVDKDTVVLLPGIRRSFGRVAQCVEEQQDALRNLKAKTLEKAFSSKQLRKDPMSVFSRCFLVRYEKHLLAEEKFQLEAWTEEFCQGSQEAVDNFLEMLKRREADLQQTEASSIEELFPALARNKDLDLRRGYDFLRREFQFLTAVQKQQVHAALQPLLQKGRQAPMKTVCDPKLHSNETVLGDGLPRPRMPKSLRQLYGNSVEAESRVMPFFHRVNEVDQYMKELRFEDCSYCNEGWFGVRTGGSKTKLPGAFESQVFRKTNFCRAPESKWLEAGRPICENCLNEAKERFKNNLPMEPLRWTQHNFVDPGEALPETDALSYFEEEILSPIQHMVRIFTLYGTGQCELRGHVGNLFQNGPQFVRDIPAAVGDMKMLLIRRCPKDPHRKQRVPFLVSRLRLERALNRLRRPVDEGGSVALRPGGLTPEGYFGLVKEENLQQYSNTEAGAEPEGLEVREVDQQIWSMIEYKLFASWVSVDLQLRLAALVRGLHEPETWSDDADRVKQTWTSLATELRNWSTVGTAEDEVETKALVEYLTQLCK